LPFRTLSKTLHGTGQTRTARLPFTIVGVGLLPSA
jgi:hypothetical protein